ncbi:hypothetical protein IQ268_08520 [Oculatella sp. LEGE 06141]|uniref:hypothetical protein n=1 Tax=Oculatella sp. LEGE 06141 TaxID=1828648 RepID=UPI001882C433|nr:hypothetical protein [Oculatella sp. LEGE 06141]MBE9178601.1 hypothetical protein [Oculatella sp. LEGE 06141]
MSGVFAGFENAQIVFETLGEDSEADEFGNSAPVCNQRSVSAKLKLASESTQRLLQHDPQVERDAIALEGHCITPMILPLNITEETEATLTFNRRSGRFRLVLINPPYGREGIGAIVEQATGTKIVGWFIPE